MRNITSLLVMCCLCGLTVGAVAQARSLCTQFGTENLVAAQAINRAAEKYEHSPSDALTAANEAIALDPQCAAAFYWKGLCMKALGDLPGCQTAWLQTYKLDAENNAFGVKAANEMGLLYGALKQYDKSRFWFSLAVVKDPEDTHKMQAKIYRNMIVTLVKLQKYNSAALVAMTAHKLDADLVSQKEVDDLLAKTDEDDNFLGMLFLDGAIPALAQRAQPPQLAPVTFDPKITDTIEMLLADTHGNYIIALPSKAKYYYLIATNVDPPVVKRIERETETICACMSHDGFFVVTGQPARLEEVDPQSGKTLGTVTLGDPAPTSIAVYLDHGVAFFPHGDGISGIKLDTGKLFKTGVSGKAVFGSPGQDFLFSYDEEEETPPVGRQRIQFRPSTIIKSVLVPDDLLIAELRLQAATFTQHLYVSPDGSWIAADGWRMPYDKTQIPNQAAKQLFGGYQVVVYSADNLEYIQGAFSATYSPIAVAFNPATQQVAICGEDHGLCVSQLANANQQALIDGKYNSAMIWSGNGYYLAAGVVNGGLAIFRNTMTTEERTLAVNWWKSLPWTQALVAPKNAVAAPQPVAALQAFAPSDNKDQMLAALNEAIAHGKTATPFAWKRYPAYAAAGDWKDLLADIDEQIQDVGNRGVLIFKLRELVKAQPDLILAKYYLAEALRLGKQPEGVAQLYLDVVHGDAGRTTLTTLALDGLAGTLEGQGEVMKALSCLAAALTLERNNPDTVQRLRRLLQANGLAETAKRVILPEGVEAATNNGTLPTLPAPPADDKIYNSTELFEKAAESVVLIKTADASGSGVCIGAPGYILTNAHVIGDETNIKVYPFIYKGGKAIRLEAISAQVVSCSPGQDLAVLKVTPLPDTLKPLPLSLSTPKTGAKIFTIGSPGLGENTLEQSISEGIIAAREREVEDKTFIQHTAAINPGNSGGPLLDEHCQVVGIVTLKAKLENVGFAIPTERIRTFYTGK